MGEDSQTLNLDESIDSAEVYKKSTIVHPNMEGQDDQELDEQARAQRAYRQRNEGACMKYLRRFDEKIMKEIFIYQYDKDKAHNMEEYHNIFVEEAEELEEQYKIEVDAMEKQE